MFYTQKNLQENSLKKPQKTCDTKQEYSALKNNHVIEEKTKRKRKKREPLLHRWYPRV